MHVATTFGLLDNTAFISASTITTTTRERERESERERERRDRDEIHEETKQKRFRKEIEWRDGGIYRLMR